MEGRPVEVVLEVGDTFQTVIQGWDFASMPRIVCEGLAVRAVSGRLGIDSVEVRATIQKHTGGVVGSSEGSTPSL